MPERTDNSSETAGRAGPLATETARRTGKPATDRPIGGASTEDWSPVDGSGRVHAYDIALRVRFRGIVRRQGIVWRGHAGWAEWSPFLEYGPEEVVPWWRAAVEAAEVGWPAPVRDVVPVNATIAAVGPEQAFRMAVKSGCRTAKIKVAEPGQSLADDLDRVAAVRDALGSSGRLRVDANGAWTVDEAEVAIRRLSPYGLEYVEQPCASVDELRALRLRLARSGVEVLIAADESIRRAADPLLVARREAADVAVLKVQPLGGVRACLEIAEQIAMPVVVSSALETSVGIAAGVALAAALPELPYACGLNTVELLSDDLAAPSLVAQDGHLTVAPIEVSRTALARTAADPAITAAWQARRMHAEQSSGLFAGGRSRG